MAKETYIIGSRGSELALWQTHHVKERLTAAHPGVHFEIKIIKTTGDQRLDVALSKIGDKGLFTREIETALLGGEIDFAVHSLKDLQTVQPEGLTIGAVSARETPNDILISTKYRSIDELPQGARVATGSLRRRSQLLHYRPDLEIVEIRGNVPTRIKKYMEAELDGLILAFAGVHRLGLDEHIAQVIPFEIMLPAVSQGVMAIEMRAGDADVEEVLRVFHDADTFACVTAERAFLRRLEGGCQVPIGANARLDGETLHLAGMVGNLEGSVNLRDRLSGPATEAETLGRTLAETLIAQGANELLDETRDKAEAKRENVV